MAVDLLLSVLCFITGFCFASYYWTKRIQKIREEKGNGS